MHHLVVVVAAVARPSGSFATRREISTLADRSVSFLSHSLLSLLSHHPFTLLFSLSILPSPLPSVFSLPIIMSHFQLIRICLCSPLSFPHFSLLLFLSSSVPPCPLYVFTSGKFKGTIVPVLAQALRYEGIGHSRGKAPHILNLSF